MAGGEVQVQVRGEGCHGIGRGCRGRGRSGARGGGGRGRSRGRDAMASRQAPHTLGELRMSTLRSLSLYSSLCASCHRKRVTVVSKSVTCQRL